MSKYTRFDADVQYLDTADRVNYEYDMTKHDVDKYVEISYAFQAMTNIKELKEKFRDWRKVGGAIITVLVFIFVFVMIIMVIMYCLMYIFKVQWKVKLLQNVSLSVTLFFVLLCIMYYIFNKLYGEMVALVEMARDNSLKKK
jgi:hypothetical protein